MNQTSAGGGPTDWPDVKRLFDAALALPAPQREAFVAAADVAPALRDEVRSLLAHAQAPDEPWLARPAAERGGASDRVADRVADGTTMGATAGAVSGQRLGAWRVVRLVGQGGMGEVYEAERADGQFEGRAAIKLLKRGMDSRAVLARFALERNALARLNHPHIARLFDAGQSEGGLPYFVMEFVDGRAIDAAARELALDDKLALFLQLTDAVAHAHRNLLLHRDLKPGNVLVTRDGQVKLLDFGIAKALDPLADGAEAGATTFDAPRPYTPHYASPEQVRGEPASTSTDVYSLGVLLYELLTGVRPTGRSATSAHDAARSVLEEQPTRPSALPPSPLPGALGDPRWPVTRRRLAGDLDNILLKALDKSSGGRYLSVDAFAADIRAFLDGHPVSARPPRAWYLVSRFVRRHRAVVGVAGFALLALLVGSGLALWQAHEAARQRDLARQHFDEVRKLANQLVFKYHDQIATLPGASKAREALLVDAGGFLDGLDEAARGDPGLAEELAGTWYRLSQLQGVDPIINIGQHGRAEQSLDKALALTRRYATLPATGIVALSQVVNMHTSRGELWQARGELGRADAALRDGLALLDQALARDGKNSWALASAVSLHGVRARILGNQMGHAHLGRWQQACDSADRARAAAEATAAADPSNKFLPDTLGFTISEQAHCRVMAGRFAEADALFTQARQLRDRMSAAMPEDIDFRYQRSLVRAHQARLWSMMARHREARELFDESLRIARAAVADDADNAAGVRRLRAMRLFDGELLLRAGQAAAARKAFGEVLVHFQAPSNQSYADVRVRAEALLLAARAARASAPAALAEARVLIDEAVALLRPAREADDNVARRWMLGQAQAEQAVIAAADNRRDDALAAARQALRSFTDSGPAPALAPLPPLLQPELAAAQRLADAATAR
ncbi:MAG: serine/threonine protein kinase [Burkholderiales bacterium]|nr:serine/threonine protein kinase [Burkholderiales bacterium]